MFRVLIAPKRHCRVDLCRMLSRKIADDERDASGHDSDEAKVFRPAAATSCKNASHQERNSKSCNDSKADSR